MGRFLPRGIGYRVGIGIFLLTMVMATQGFLARWGVGAVADGTDRQAAIAADLKGLGDIIFTVKSLQEIPADYLAVGSTANRSEHQDAIASARQAIAEHRGKALAQSEADAWSTVEAALADLDAVATEILSLEKPVGHPQAGALMNRLDEATAKAIEAVRAIEDTYQNASVQMAAEAKSLRHRIDVITIVVTLAAILFSILMNILVTRSVAGPVRKVVDVARKVAEGDLTRKVSVQSRDELGELAHDFNIMIDSLRELLARIKSSSQHLAASSEEMTAGVEEVAAAMSRVAASVGEVAEGAEQQSSTTQETARAMEELRQAIHRISRGAETQAQSARQTSSVMSEMARAIDAVATSGQEVAAVAAQALNAARNGGSAVEKTVQGMDRIRHTALDAAERVRALGEQSGRIGEIVAVIGDIADQTNLLALNAAIEAARAGEHGKGFAVVADEVRKLAERSGRAAKEIEELIGGIQRGVSDAVEAMGAGTREVEAGTALVGEAGAALQEILAAMDRTNREVQNISAAAEEVAASAAGVLKAVEEVARITSENTAATEEMDGSSESVSRSVQGIAGISARTAGTAKEVAAAAEEAHATVRQIGDSARNLATLAGEMQQLTERFRL